MLLLTGASDGLPPSSDSVDLLTLARLLAALSSFRTEHGPSSVLSPVCRVSELQL